MELFIGFLASFQQLKRKTERAKQQNAQKIKFLIINIAEI